MIPDGITFRSDAKYDDRCRAFSDLLEALPSIDGWKPSSKPPDLNELAQSRLDAREIGEISAAVSVEEWADQPTHELAEYRYRFNKKRRQLIRPAMTEVMARVDAVLREMRAQYEDTLDVDEQVKASEWDQLKEYVEQIGMLLGNNLAKPPRWNDLHRHLGRGMVKDLIDILRLDWPEIKTGLTKSLYDEDEPVPVGVADLGTLVASHPAGPVATKLKWDSLTAEDFERLMFDLIAGAKGYENPEWLMQTNAPDRGRDLSVTRVIEDPLAGVSRVRVIIQCRHWTMRSVSAKEVATLKEQLVQWEPPKVGVLVIATTGRFTSDAVAVIERHNDGDRALRIEMWPDSHLERLLATRPALIAEFRLR